MKIRVHNWQKYNPRSDRKAHSWFRLEIRWFDNEQLFDLTPQQKLMWPMVLGMYAEKQTSDFIDLNIKYVAYKSGLDEQFIISTLQVFESRKLLDIEHTSDTAVTPTGDRLETSCLTTNERTNERTIVPKGTCATEAAPKPDEKADAAAKLAELWNKHCGSLPKVVALNATRRRSALARLKEHPDMAIWERAAQTIAKSAFHNGKNDRGWRADFDYFIKPNTVLKATEGAMSASKGQTATKWKSVVRNDPSENLGVEK